MNKSATAIIPKEPCLCYRIPLNSQPGMYVCMYACMYVCMYVYCMYVCMYISEHIYSLSELHIYSSLPFVFILFVSGLTFISERHSNSRFLFTTLLTAPTDMPNWLLQIVGWNFQLPLGLPSSLTELNFSSYGETWWEFITCYICQYRWRETFGAAASHCGAPNLLFPCLP